VSSYDPWSLYIKELDQLLEISPVVAAALTASIAPLEEDAQGLAVRGNK